MSTGLNKVCNLKPEYCFACIDDQIVDGVELDCKKCINEDSEYELIDVGVAGIFQNAYAILLKNGKLKKVPLYRVFNVREKE